MWQQFNNQESILKADVLIIGSGLAGLLAALKLSESGISVTLACKGNLVESNSAHAQGGIAASTKANCFDTPDLHLEDTIKAGGGLVDPNIAREIIFSGSKLIDQLQNLGIAFDRDQSGLLSLAREGGHSQARVLHNKDATGRTIVSTLITRLKERKSVTILENAFALRLLTNEGVCLGAAFDLSGGFLTIFANQTILATGGLGQVYSRTTNPAIATGDGIALAYRAGAALIDMEFVQFHPTALALADAPPFLISEAVRGAGAKLLDGKGNYFMSQFHPDGDLATRDIVARAIHSVIMAENSSSVFLDLRPIGKNELSARFPNIIQTCKTYGIDLLTELVPVSPASHYFMGGILADINGNTSIEKLSAIGECASIGLHGANRLASNSLLEAGAGALRLADHLITKGSFDQPVFTNKQADYPIAYCLPDNIQDLKKKMYLNVSLIRNQLSLESMENFLSHCSLIEASAATRQIVEQANIHLLAGLITKAALNRQESRGAHFRSDYPNTDNQDFQKRLVVCRSQYYWSPISTSKLANKELIAR